jgi:drug/metabolite transporter (DMT)-like permease
MKLNWHHVVGYIFIVIASCFFGGSASLGKTLMQNGLSTVMLMQARSLLTALLLLPFLIFFAPGHLRISRRDLPALVALAIPGLALVNASYYHALKLLTIALAVFIQFTAPVFILLYGLLTRKEHLNQTKVLALLLSLAGTFLMVQLHGQHLVEVSSFGIACAFVSMLSYAFYVILSHRLSTRHSAWTLLIYGYGIAALFWCLIENPQETFQQITRNNLWPHTILFSLLSTVIPFVFFLTGLWRVTPTGGSIAATSETVMASLFAFLLLGERLSSGQIAGAVLILSAVLILIYQSRGVPVLEEV